MLVTPGGTAVPVEAIETEQRDEARVLPLLEELKQHQKTRGFAETALEDIEMFARQP